MNIKLSLHTKCGTANVKQDLRFIINITLSVKLSKPQPNLNTTVGFYTKMTLQPLPTTHHHPHKPNVSNISSVTDPISPKL